MGGGGAGTRQVCTEWSRLPRGPSLLLRCWFWCVGCALLSSHPSPSQRRSRRRGRLALPRHRGRDATHSRWGREGGGWRPRVGRGLLACRIERGGRRAAYALALLRAHGRALAEAWSPPSAVGVNISRSCVFAILVRKDKSAGAGGRDAARAGGGKESAQKSRPSLVRVRYDNNNKKRDNKSGKDALADRACVPPPRRVDAEPCRRAAGRKAVRPPRCVGEHDAKGRMADKGDHDGDAARARAVAGGSGGRRHVTPRDVRSRSSRHRQVQVPGGCRAGRGPPIRRGGGTADPPWARGRSAVGRRQAAAAGWSAPDGRPHSGGPPCGHSSPAAYQWQCVVARPRFPPLLPPRSTHPAAVFFFSSRTLTHCGCLRTRSFCASSRACRAPSNSAPTFPNAPQSHGPHSRAVLLPAAATHGQTRPTGTVHRSSRGASRPGRRRARAAGPHTVWRPRRYGRPWPSRGCHRGVIHTLALARRRWAAPHAPRLPRSACRGGRSHHAAPRHGGDPPTPRHAVRPQRSAAHVPARALPRGTAAAPPPRLPIHGGRSAGAHPLKSALGPPMAPSRPPPAPDRGRTGRRRAARLFDSRRGAGARRAPLLARRRWREGGGPTGSRARRLPRVCPVPAWLPVAGARPRGRPRRMA